MDQRPAQNASPIVTSLGRILGKGARLKVAKLQALADAARDARDWVAAASAYEEVLAATPERADLWVQYGHALKEAGRPEDAASAYRRGSSLSPADPDPVLHLAHLLKALGRREEAIAAFTALADRGELQEANIELAGMGAAPVAPSTATLPELHKPAPHKAPATAAPFLRYVTRTAGFRSAGEKLVARADKARDRGQPVIAARLYEQAIAKLPSRSDLKVQRANMLKDSGAFADAEAAYLDAMKTDGQTSDIQLQLGHLYKLWGKRTPAINAFRQAVKLDRTSPARAELETLGVSADSDAETAKRKARKMALRLSAAALKDFARHEPYPRELPSVIIPVFNAADHVKACLESVLKYTDSRVRIIVINDASTDPRISPLLEGFARNSSVELISNSENLGFTRSVNLGIAAAGASDVVLLNSDTIITPMWLQNMRFAAYSDRRIATATACSDNAGAFSVPEMGQKNDVPEWLSPDDYARLITRTSPRTYPRVPTGNGFCMYIRRGCLDEVGQLDEAAFPRGYGEENDFCMRALRAGWRHVIDDATIVYHARSVSFGPEKAELLARGRQIVDERYPEYGTLIQAFRTDEAVLEARATIRKIATLPITGTPLRPRVLFIVSTQTGGTPQTNQDLMGALRDRYEPLLLRCDSQRLYLYHIDGEQQHLIENIRLDQPLKGFPHTSRQYDETFRRILEQYSIELVHMRHLAWHSLNVPQICQEAMVPTIFSFHDFYTICPTVKLLDNHLQYCAGKCTRAVGECQHELWTEPDFPPLKHRAIRTWQAAMADMLDHCDAFVTTDESARRQILDIYPQLAEKPFQVIPHGRDLRFTDAVRRDREDRVRIIVPGNINEAKGSKIIQAIARLDVDRQLEFHILGNSRIKEKEGFVHHGPYKRDQFSELVQGIQPDFGLVLSVWPETFCHTLTEMWACNVPVAAIGLGAVGNRIAKHGGGWLLTSSDPAEIYQQILDIVADRAGFAARMQELETWKRSTGQVHTNSFMAHRYDALYRSLLSRNVPAGDALYRVAIASPLHAGTWPASTHVRVIEKTRNSAGRAINYSVMAGINLTPERLSGYDAIMCQRDALLNGDYVAIREAARAQGIPFLFEVDDDLLSTSSSSEAHAYFSFMHSEADHLICSTPTLADRIASVTPCSVLPNALAERLWLSPISTKTAGAPERRDADEFRVLYMGTKTHAADLELLREPFARLRARYPHLRLFTVGVTPEAGEGWYEPIQIPDNAKAYPSFVLWLRSITPSMDLAVAPLVNSSFNQAKSGLKYLEYGAAGLCGIYSDIEPYREVVRHGETGFLTDNSVESWCAHIAAMIEDSDLRKAVSQRAREDVLANHRIKHAAEKLDGLIVSLIQDSHAAGQVASVPSPGPAELREASA